MPRISELPSLTASLGGNDLVAIVSSADVVTYKATRSQLFAGYRADNMGAGRILGRSSSGQGTVEEIALGAGISLSGGTLSVSGGTLSAPSLLVGRYSSGAGAVEEINLGSTLQIAGSTLQTTGLLGNSVSAPSRLLGRFSSGAGTVEELVVGSNLSVSSGTLNATGGGSVTFSATQRLLGRFSAGSGAGQEVTLGTTLTLGTTGQLDAVVGGYVVGGSPRLTGRVDAGSGAQQDVTLGGNLTMTGTGTGTLAATNPLATTDTVVRGYLETHEVGARQVGASSGRDIVRLSPVAGNAFVTPDMFGDLAVGLQLSTITVVSGSNVVTIGRRWCERITNGMLVTASAASGNVLASVAITGIDLTNGIITVASNATGNGPATLFIGPTSGQLTANGTILQAFLDYAGDYGVEARMPTGDYRHNIAGGLIFRRGVRVLATKGGGGAVRITQTLDDNACAVFSSSGLVIEGLQFRHATTQTRTLANGVTLSTTTQGAGVTFAGLPGTFTAADVGGEIAALQARGRGAITAVNADGSVATADTRDTATAQGTFYTSAFQRVSWQPGELTIDRPGGCVVVVRDCFVCSMTDLQIGNNTAVNFPQNPALTIFAYRGIQTDEGFTNFNNLWDGIRIYGWRRDAIQVTDASDDDYRNFYCQNGGNISGAGYCETVFLQANAGADGRAFYSWNAEWLNALHAIVRNFNGRLKFINGHMEGCRLHWYGFWGEGDTPDAITEIEGLKVLNTVSKTGRYWDYAQGPGVGKRTNNATDWFKFFNLFGDARTTVRDLTFEWKYAVTAMAVTVNGRPNLTNPGRNYQIDRLYTVSGANSGTGTNAAWLATTLYAVGDIRGNFGEAYICRTAGTSGTTGGPRGRSTAVADGTITWDHISLFSGAILSGVVPYLRPRDPAWAISTAYGPGSVVDNNGQLYVSRGTGAGTGTGTSAASGGPTGTVFGTEITDNTMRWQYIGTAYLPFWGTTTSYDVDSIVRVGTQGYIARGSGTSGTVAPAGTAYGSAIVDGGVIWHYIGRVDTPARATSTAYAVGDIVSSNGSCYICATAGTSGTGGGPSGTGTGTGTYINGVGGSNSWAFINDGGVVWGWLQHQFIAQTTFGTTINGTRTFTLTDKGARERLDNMQLVGENVNTSRDVVFVAENVGMPVNFFDRIDYKIIWRNWPSGGSEGYQPITEFSNYRYTRYAPPLVHGWRTALDPVAIGSLAVGSLPFYALGDHGAVVYRRDTTTGGTRTAVLLGQRAPSGSGSTWPVADGWQVEFVSVAGNGGTALAGCDVIVAGGVGSGAGTNTLLFGTGTGAGTAGTGTILVTSVTGGTGTLIIGTGTAIGTAAIGTGIGSVFVSQRIATTGTLSGGLGNTTLTFGSGVGSAFLQLTSGTGSTLTTAFPPGTTTFGTTVLGTVVGTAASGNIAGLAARFSGANVTWAA